MITRRHTLAALALLAALMLAGCGAPAGANSNPLQGFIRLHTQCPAAQYSVTAWLPDPGGAPGGLIFYDVLPPGPGAVGSVPALDLHVMSPTGSGDRLVGHDINAPQLSPDGSLALFSRLSIVSLHAEDYYLLDVRSGQIRLVIQPGSHASWSPDGKWIVYAAPPPGGIPIDKLNVSTGQVVSLTDPQQPALTRNIFPIWSPDGKWIAFSSNRDGAFSAYIMSADGEQAGLTRLPPKADPVCAAPRQVTEFASGWSNDGQSLVVSHGCDGSRDTLRIVSTDGTELQDWSGLNLKVSFEGWSPQPDTSGQGSRVLFINDDPGGVRRFGEADPDGTHMQLPRTLPGYPVWSPDGRRVAYSARDAAGLSQIYVMNADGTGVTQITQNPGAGICLH